MILLFAYMALVALFGLSIFQAALIFGAPLGRFAWGGGNETLPKRLRIASVVSVLLYTVFAAFIALKAGIIEVNGSEQVVTTLMWVFTAYFFVGIAMNAVSRSAQERNIMTPVAAVLALSFLVVALN